MNKIKVVKGDITKIDCDVIVNAANSTLLGGGGVDGAIHRAGGIKILKECKEIGGCNTGEAVMTTSGKLPSKKVIHTVGPIWDGSSDMDKLLRNCYLNSLKLTKKSGYKSIAFPNISTGAYGFPKKRAAKIAIETVKEYVEGDNFLEKVIFVCFDDENYGIYEKIFETTGWTQDVHEIL